MKKSQPGIGGRRILLVGPQAPPYGGMALQAQKLERFLRLEGNSVDFFPSNLPFPNGLRFVDHLRGARPFVRSALIWLGLYGRIRRTDVVHVLAASWLYFFLVVAPAVILSRVHGKKVIINYRSGEGEQFFRSYGWLAKPLFRLASAVTVPSDYLGAAIYRHFGVQASIIPNIVDFSSFPYRERAVFQPKIVVTRHLEKIYGIESVIRAFGKIQKLHPEASLAIAGTGSQEDDLSSLVQRSQLKNVRFLGHVPHCDLAALYDRCDILLNGSQVDNFPGSLLEASASGLAVVSTNAGGIPFIYETGVNAILVAPDDWEGLAAGVERVLQDTRLGAEMTTAALQLCQQCDWVNVRRLLYQSYGIAVPDAQTMELRDSSYSRSQLGRSLKV